MSSLSLKQSSPSTNTKQHDTVDEMDNSLISGDHQSEENVIQNKFKSCIFVLTRQHKINLHTSQTNAKWKFTTWNKNNSQKKGTDNWKFIYLIF